MSKYRLEYQRPEKTEWVESRETEWVESREYESIGDLIDDFEDTIEGYSYRIVKVPEHEIEVLE